MRRDLIRWFAVLTSVLRVYLFEIYWILIGVERMIQAIFLLISHVNKTCDQCARFYPSHTLLACHILHILTLHVSICVAGVVESESEYVTFEVSVALSVYIAWLSRCHLFVSCMLLFCSTESFNSTCFFLWSSLFVFVLFLLLPKNLLKKVVKLSPYQPWTG